VIKTDNHRRRFLVSRNANDRLAALMFDYKLHLSRWSGEKILVVTGNACREILTL